MRRAPALPPAAACFLFNVFTLLPQVRLALLFGQIVSRTQTAAAANCNKLCSCVERGYITRVMQGGGLCIMVPRFGLETAVKVDDAKAFSFVSAEMKLQHKHSGLE